MRWQGRRQSGNVIDRRGMGGGGLAVGGGVGTVVLALLYFLMGGDPSVIFNGGAGTAPSSGYTQSAPNSEEAQKEKEFVSVVLADTEDVWSQLFRQDGLSYEEPKLVLFSGQVNSACGTASAAVGPFYCPGDDNVYIDLRFYDQLRQRFGAPGDFAQAYVIAHEVGHHVQDLLGISDRIHQLQQRSGEDRANRLSVMLELQADYLAGVFAHHARRMESLNRQDIEEALGAAHAVGDDTLQQETQGYVVPDSFTHGTSEQRMAAFSRGFETGTFDPSALRQFEEVSGIASGGP